MNYEEIFRQRGGAYHDAMRRWPQARREEFGIPVAAAALSAGSIVVDVPAGGGYLRGFLPSGCEWRGHEPCASFLGANAANSGLLPLPWPDQSADAAISIAGVHHIADKRPLYTEFARVLKPGGRLVLADAHVESRVARFLDEFVGKYNTTGHSGDYLDERTTAQIDAAGFDVRASKRTRYCWWFADRLQMGAFCRLLFDIRKLSEREVADGIEEYLGVTVREDAADSPWGMNWELLIVSAERSRR